MPQAKKLTGKATPPVKQTTPVVKPTIPEKQTITKSDVGTVPAGLMKSNQATIPAKVNIPGFLQTSNMPDVSNRQQTGYVGFASTQSKKWGIMQSAGLEDGQPFLYHQNSYIPLATVDFFLCMGASFQTMMVGKEGSFIYACTDMNIALDPIVYKGQAVKLEPHYVCLLLVNLNGQLIPIKGDFRGTKSGGMENAIRAVEAASNPDWLKLSDTHKATAAFPQPWGRVYHRISTKRGVSKSNGNPYHSANCSSSPASVTQMQLLVASLADDAFNNNLTEAHNNYNGRLEFMNSVVGQGTDILDGKIKQPDSTKTTGDPVPF